MKEGSQMLIASDDEGIVERAYGVAPEQSRVWLDGVLSRKKQVVPPLQDAFA
jgi:manganese-dependent inorganic pyrophosphatase